MTNACRVCGRGTLKVLHSDVRDYEHGRSLGQQTAVTFDRCQECAMLWQNPTPTASFLQAAYPKDYRPHVVQKGLLNFLKKIQARLLARRLLKFLGGPSRDLKILEVGCGGGYLLRALSETGYKNLYGIDQSPELAKNFESTQIQFKALDIEATNDWGLQQGSFSIIILVNVLEHLLEPQRVLKTLHRLLRPDGVLLIVTPNAHSLSHLIFGKYWSGLHTPRHPMIFTPKALELMLSHSGFGQSTFYKLSDVSTWAFSFQNALSQSALDRLTGPRSSGTAWYSLLGLPLWYPWAWLEKWLGLNSSILAKFAYADSDPKSDSKGGAHE